MGADTEYLPSYQAALIFRHRNMIMKPCSYEDDEENCPQYREKCSKPGYVDLTCWRWRADDEFCDAPPLEDITNQPAVKKI